MSENIVVHIEVDGIKTSSIRMGENRPDPVYPADVMFFSGGSVFDKERTSELYQYSFKLIRRKLIRRVAREEINIESEK